MEGEVLEFPNGRPRGQDYSTGWMDGCAFGEHWAGTKLFWLGVVSGVMLAVLVAGLIFWWAGAQ